MADFLNKIRGISTAKYKEIEKEKTTQVIDFIEKCLYKTAKCGGNSCEIDFNVLNYQQETGTFNYSITSTMLYGTPASTKYNFDYNYDEGVFTGCLKKAKEHFQKLNLDVGSGTRSLTFTWDYLPEEELKEFIFDDTLCNILSEDV